MTHLIFVYGTIKRGYINHRRVLSSATFVSEAKTEPRFVILYDGHLPYMIAKDEGLAVQGEIFAVDDDTLSGLDRLEGHPDFYIRTPIKATLPCGQIVDAFVYLASPRTIKSSGLLEMMRCGKAQALDNFNVDGWKDKMEPTKPQTETRHYTKTNTKKLRKVLEKLQAMNNAPEADLVKAILNKRLNKKGDGETPSPS